MNADTQPKKKIDRGDIFIGYICGYPADDGTDRFWAAADIQTLLRI
jgi:hypothetical protein